MREVHLIVNNMTLKKEFEKLADAYVKVFEKKYDLELEFWVGDCVGEMACFGDTYFFTFDNIRLCVDTDIDKKILFEWHEESIDYNTLKEPADIRHINLESYCKGIRYSDLAK